MGTEAWITVEGFDFVVNDVSTRSAISAALSDTAFTAIVHRRS